MAPPKIGKKVQIRLGLAHHAIIEEAPGETQADKLRFILDDYTRLKHAERQQRTAARATPGKR